MNFDEQQAVTHCTEHGAGWRLDCLGDMRMSSENKFFSPEMLDIYPQQVVRAGIQDVWQPSPVSLAGCPVIGLSEPGRLTTFWAKRWGGILRQLTSNRRQYRRSGEGSLKISSGTWVTAFSYAAWSTPLRRERGR